MTQPARDHISGAFIQYDYTNQAWLHDGVYQKCRHLECEYVKGYEKQCYGSKHEGEASDPEAHVEPQSGPAIDAADITWSDIGPSTHEEQGEIDKEGVFHPFTPCTYDPVPLLGQPIGMFHCPLCGEMVLAGLPHP